MKFVYHKNKNIKPGTLLESVIKFGHADIGDLAIFLKTVKPNTGETMFECIILTNNKRFSFFCNEFVVINGGL